VQRPPPATREHGLTGPVLCESKEVGVQRSFMPLSFTLFLTAFVAQSSVALQRRQVRNRFEAADPFLRVGHIGVEQLGAEEVTAYLRLNPRLSLIADQINPFRGGPPHGTFGTSLSVAAASSLHERQHKGKLRQQSAQDATGVTASLRADLERTPLFDLRAAFFQILPEKVVFSLAQENLSYYTHVIDVNRRSDAGGISQVNLNRLKLGRIQHESD
jgi:outer membrane protein, heavy metal efflux system